MLGADVGQSPHAPEDGSVSAPVVTVESSEQFTAYGNNGEKEVSAGCWIWGPCASQNYITPHLGWLWIQPYEIIVIDKGAHGIVSLSVSILTLPLTWCVSLGKLTSQFPHL